MIREFNNNASICDEIIGPFLQGFEKCKIGQYNAEKPVGQPYRSKELKDIIIATDPYKINELYEKYERFDHPYIYSTIAGIYLKSEDIITGTSILLKAFRHTENIDSYFWHSEYGVAGQVHALMHLQEILGYKGMAEVDNNESLNFLASMIMKIFIYLTRYICSDWSVYVKSEMYRHRAEMNLCYSMFYTPMFGIGINPEIHYISDMKSAYDIIPDDGPKDFYRQCYLDSLKFYRHGSLVPNLTGGYKEIEEIGYDELVLKGKIRSEYIANNQIDKLKSGRYTIKYETYLKAIDIAVKLNYKVIGKRVQHTFDQNWAFNGLR